MSRVTYNQRGYVGSSMSVRALEAYENGEMPKSKWTKKVMLEVLAAYCDDNDLLYDTGVEKMKKDELFSEFFQYTGWHHTGKYANETSFYGIDEDAVVTYFQPLSDKEILGGNKVNKRIRDDFIEGGDVDWCRNYETKDERYKFIVCMSESEDPHIGVYMIDDEEVLDFDPEEIAEKLARHEDENYKDYVVYEKQAALGFLTEALEAKECFECPWFEECDLMNQEVEEEDWEDIV